MAVATEARVMRWLGVGVALAAVWPIAHALEAVAARDYLGTALLLGLTWVLARTGVELSGLGGGARGTGDGK